jgi:gluconokinase
MLRNPRIEAGAFSSLWTGVRRPVLKKNLMVVMLMGVAGSGKTTVGRLLAAALGWKFRDADEFHPAANVAKMAAGRPLDDADRAPWLAAIRAGVEQALAAGEDTVVTCSALKEQYRRALEIDPVRIRWVHLQGDPELIRGRLAARRGHFMKPEMLRSQLAALEPPRDALVLDVADPPETLVAKIRAELLGFRAP